MTSKSKDLIKAFFETGDKPTQSQFIDLIDSYVDKSGPLGVLETAVSGGSAGFIYASAADAKVINAATALTNLGATVYTTALTSAVAIGLVATTAQAIAGTATGVLMDPVTVKNAIASQAGGSGAKILLASATANNSASISFTTNIDGTYDVYEIELVNITPVSDGAQLNMTASSDGGSTYGTSYARGEIQATVDASFAITGAGAQSTTEMRIAYNIGSAAAECICSTIKFWSPSGTAKQKLFYSTCLTLDTSTNVQLDNNFWTVKSTAAINAIKFAMDSGNISTGSAYLYGIKKS